MDKSCVISIGNLQVTIFHDTIHTNRVSTEDEIGEAISFLKSGIEQLQGFRMGIYTQKKWDRITSNHIEFMKKWQINPEST